jgi:hypothetical protein
MNKNTSLGQILISFAHSSCLLPDDSAGMIARELWWTNQMSSSVNIIFPPFFPCSCITWEMTNRLVADRSLEPLSYPIDMIINPRIWHKDRTEDIDF